MEKRKRPKQTTSESHKIPTGCGTLYVTPGWDGDSLIEVFASLGKSGSCPRAMLEAITRSLSLGLKYGIPIEEYIKEFEDIKCPNRVWEDGVQIMSCADAVAKVLKNACRANQSNKVPK